MSQPRPMPPPMPCRDRAVHRQRPPLSYPRPQLRNPPRKSMLSALRVVRGPAVEPVTLDQVRAHCRIYTDDEDELLALYIASARAWTETYLGRALITQQLQWIMADRPPEGAWPYTSLPFTLVPLPLWFPWPQAISRPLSLPRQPVQKIDQVSVGRWGEADLVLDPGTYSADIGAEPGRIRISLGAQPVPGQHIAVTFTAGYGDRPDQVPPLTRQAILHHVAWLYENRGDADGEVPRGIISMLPDRCVTFGG